MQRDADALVELAQRALDSGGLPTEGGERPQVVTVPLAVLQGRIGSASLALGSPINADIVAASPVMRGLFRWCLAAEVNRLTSDAPVTRCRRRFAEPWSCGMVAVLSQGVLYQLAGAIFTMSFIGLTTARLAS